MRLMNRLVAFNRAMRLRRQLTEIQKLIDGLPPRMQPQLAILVRRELDLAGKCEFPVLYGTPEDHPPGDIGTGSDVGLVRARSESMQARMRGIALWIAVVFHESRGSKDPQMLTLHRGIITVLRQFREVEQPTDATVAWMGNGNRVSVN